MDKISALMDSELGEHEARGQVSRLKDDEELARTWHTFHLIGDAMRGERPLSPGFGARLSDRLAAEPTVLAPQRRPAKRLSTYALSAAASVSAVALVGWIAFYNQPYAPPATIVKAPVAPAPAPIASPPPQLASVPSEGRMNEYLIAHQEFSPSTAIQGLAPYIRSVSSTRSTQGR